MKKNIHLNNQVQWHPHAKVKQVTLRNCWYNLLSFRTFTILVVNLPSYGLQWQCKKSQRKQNQMWRLLNLDKLFGCTCKSVRILMKQWCIIMF